MARLPLTVYLLRADLVRLDNRARIAGLARSAWAGNAIRATLHNEMFREDMLREHMRHQCAALDELIAVHTASAEMRQRIADRLNSYDRQTDERNPS